MVLLWELTPPSLMFRAMLYALMKVAMSGLQFEMKTYPTDGSDFSTKWLAANPTHLLRAFETDT